MKNTYALLQSPNKYIIRIIFKIIKTEYSRWINVYLE